MVIVLALVFGLCAITPLIAAGIPDDVVSSEQSLDTFIKFVNFDWWICRDWFFEYCEFIAIASRGLGWL